MLTTQNVRASFSTEPLLRAGFCNFMIQLKNVIKTVRSGSEDLTILNDVSFDIPDGEFVAVTGASGSGKSTLLNIISGLVTPTQGRVRFDGEDVTRSSPAQMINHGVTYVPQGRNVIPQLSVWHNLEMGGITSSDQASVRRRMDMVMDQFPMLRQFRDRKAIELSGGQQKQLEIARALLLDPKLILIDEPSIGLSPLIVADVFKLLRTLAELGA